jgi:alginate O-acetyltransferase complex protein AlgI
MLFQSWPFALFFLIVYPTYLILKKTRLGIFWLLAASYFFYGWINPLYLILILYVTAIDYFAASRMARRPDSPASATLVARRGGRRRETRGREKSPHRKMWLIVSVVNNVGLLGFFKYAGFITDHLNALLMSLKIPYEIAPPGFLLPVGISFYIFQSMSYTIDFYRGNIPREKSFIRYAAFVSFFPRLLMGPIERAKNFLPQLHKTPDVSWSDIADGLSLFVVGLFKKVALADFLKLYVVRVYDNPEQFQSPSLILATFLFAWQIYFDFSGYTDMARGVARTMGFRLKLNFNNPYIATGLSDFWHRWHISLSSWFRDYVYIPLGGNRRGTFNTYRNIFLTMIISGLWHAGLFSGATLTFVIWGVVHTFGLFLTRELERTEFYKEKTPKLLKQIFVFCFVCFAWIFFRADSISDAWLIIRRIFTSGFSNPYCPVLALVLIFAVWLYQFMYESRIKWLLDLKLVRITIVVLMIFYLAVFAPSSEQAFIYMRF